MRTQARVDTGYEEAALAAEVSALRRDQIPTDVVDAAIDCMIDTLAAAIGAGSEEVVDMAARLSDGPGPCTRFSDGKTVSAQSAALVNGTAAHVLDFDDWLPVSGLHPSAPLLPAVLALAQSGGGVGLTESLSNRLLTAYIAGFEAQARIGHVLAPHHYEAGFHPTATVGIFGAAAGAAHLLGSDARTTLRAWGLASTQASGIRAVFGTMGKSFQVGRASEAGLLAARLSASGATAPENALFGPHGFAETHGYDIALQPVAVPFVERWYMRDALVKRHAACFGTHATIEALLALRDTVDPTRVREIELTVPEFLRTVCAIPKPSTPLEGKFSLSFTAALALKRGSCQVADFTRASVRDPELTSLVERVRLRFDSSLQSQQTRVRITLNDGSEVIHSADSAAPPTPQERHTIVRDKFRSAAAPTLGRQDSDALLTAIEGLRCGGSESTMMDLLGTAWSTK